MLASVEAKTYGGGWQTGLAISTAVDPVSLDSWLLSFVPAYFRNTVAARFASEGDRNSGPWAALSPITVRIRESMGFPGPHPINFMTGEMYRWAVSQNGSLEITAGGAVVKYPADSPSGKLATKVAAAQFGGRGPARPIFAVGEEDAQVIALALEKKIRRQINSVLAAAEHQRQRDLLLTAGPPGDPYNLDARFGGGAAAAPVVHPRVTKPVINKSGRRGGLGGNFRGITY